MHAHVQSVHAHILTELHLRGAYDANFLLGGHGEGWFVFGEARGHSGRPFDANSTQKVGWKLCRLLALIQRCVNCVNMITCGEG